MRFGMKRLLSRLLVIALCAGLISLGAWADLEPAPEETIETEETEPAPEETVETEETAEPAPEETVEIEETAESAPEETVGTEEPAEPAPEEAVEAEDPSEEPLEDEEPVPPADGLSPTWSLPTLEGGTVTQDTYRDKVQLLVFYRGRLNNEKYVCYNSYSILADLADADWIGDESVQVIAMEADGNDTDTVSRFREYYAPDCSDIVFALEANELMWELARAGGMSGSITFPVCAVLRDGELEAVWDGYTTAGTCRTAVFTSGLEEGGSLTLVPKTSVPVRGRYHQEEVRSMLAMINGFRTAEGTWYWNSDNKSKTLFNTDGGRSLGPLVYDYDLERVAMERAAELAVQYSHLRPDGNDCFTVYYNGTRSWGENIAHGQTTAEEVFEDWKEENMSFSGQGHRRIMLGDYTAVGLACFRCGGEFYWVQEFGYESSGAAETVIDGGLTVIDVPVQDVSRTEKPLEGFFRDEEDHLYYYSGGARLADSIYTIWGQVYVFGEDGTILRNDWYSDGWYDWRFGDDGAMLYDTWLTLEDGVYYLDEYGTKLWGETEEIDGVTYTFDLAGRLTGSSPAAPTPTPVPTSTASPRGDCSGDRLVNLQDRVYLARHLADWDGYPLPDVSAADCSRDGQVDRQDRVYLARYLAGWEEYSLE